MPSRQQAIDWNNDGIIHWGVLCLTRPSKVKALLEVCDMNYSIIYKICTWACLLTWSNFNLLWPVKCVMKLLIHFQTLPWCSHWSLEMKSNFIPHFIMGVMTYSYWDESQFMLVNMLYFTLSVLQDSYDAFMCCFKVGPLTMGKPYAYAACRLIKAQLVVRNYFHDSQDNRYKSNVAWTMGTNLRAWRAQVGVISQVQ